MEDILNIFKPKTREEIIGDLNLKRSVKKFLIKNEYSLIQIKSEKCSIENIEVFYFLYMGAKEVLRYHSIITVTNRESLADLKRTLKIFVKNKTPHYK